MYTPRDLLYRASHKCLENVKTAIIKEMNVLKEKKWGKKKSFTAYGLCIKTDSPSQRMDQLLMQSWPDLNMVITFPILELMQRKQS